MIKALIFDFDGTIVDTESLDFRCWQEIYREFDCELDSEAWMRCIGTTFDEFSPYDDLGEKLSRKMDENELRRLHRDKFRDQAMSSPALEGVLDCIRYGKSAGLKLGLASSATSDWVTEHLERRALLHYFDSIRCVDHVGIAKPHPKVYQSVLEALNVNPNEAIAFEDSPNGVKAAKAAGIFCVAIPNLMTCNSPFDHADERVEKLSVERLQEWIRRLDAKAA